MLSPRWRKVLRDLWTSKMRTVLVVLSIAVGVFAVGMISGIQVIFGKDLSVAFNAVNPASATLYTDWVDADFVQSVGNMRELSDAQGRGTTTVRSKIGAGEWKSLSVTSYEDFEDIRINKMRPVAGAFPPGAKEILIERSSMEWLGAKLGDTITVEVASGKKYDLRIVGSVHDLNSPPAMFAGQGSGYVTPDTMEWLGMPREFSQINIVVAENGMDKNHVQTVANHVRDKVEKSGRSVYYTYIGDPGKHPVDSAIQAFLMLLGALGFLSLLLSGFLVVNTISALLAQHVRQIGVMKSVGARRGQIVGMYMTTVLIYGLLALGVAVPLGAVAAAGVGGFLASMMNFDPVTTGIPMNVLVMETAVGLLVPVVAALWPVLSGTSVTVREALETQGIGKSAAGEGLLDRMLRAIRILSRPMLLSLRNTFRRKGRLALTLATLILGGSIFIAIFSVRESVTVTLDEALQSFNYDAEVNFTRGQRIDQLEREAHRVPGVEIAEGVGASTLRRVRPDGNEGQNAFMLAMPAESKLIAPTLIEGRWLLPDDENAIVVNTLWLKDETDVKVGSAITMKMDGRDTEWRVVGIVRGVMTGPIVYANRPYFTNISRGGTRTGSLWVVTERHDVDSVNQTTKAIEEHFKVLGMRVSNMQTIASIRAMVQGQFDVIIVFLMVMAVLLAVVGGLGLMGTMSLNVIERTREFGVMRAIGASDGAVQKVVMVEGMLIGVLSWIAAAIIAAPISRLLSDQVGMAFLQAPMSPAYSIQGMLIWLGIVVVLSALASFLPARNASRVSVREVLAYE